MSPWSQFGFSAYILLSTRTADAISVLINIAWICTLWNIWQNAPNNDASESTVLSAHLKIEEEEIDQR